MSISAPTTAGIDIQPIQEATDTELVTRRVIVTNSSSAHVRIPGKTGEAKTPMTLVVSQMPISNDKIAEIRNPVIAMQRIKQLNINILDVLANLTTNIENTLPIQNEPEYTAVKYEPLTFVHFSILTANVAIRPPNTASIDTYNIIIIKTLTNATLRNINFREILIHFRFVLDFFSAKLSFVLFFF